MRTRELLLECRAKHGWQSDYRLAKELGLPTQRIYDYMSEKRTPDTYALIRIAECLAIDPLELIAEVEQAKAKNKIEKAFWVDFYQRVKKPVGGFLVALLCTLTLLIGQGHTAERASVFRRFKHA